jgi:sugar phosphate isomerase/epimerase
MKYSFMSFSTPKLKLAEMLAVAQRYGYDGIEPRLDAQHAHGIEVCAAAPERAAIRDRVAASGIRLSCLATSLVFANPATAADMLRQAHERIDLAGDLGAPAIRVFGGQIPAGLSRAAAVDQVAGALRAVAAHAGERGVTLCLETHDDWCDPADVAAVLARADHPAVAANWDVMHPVRTGKATIDSSFQTLKPWIRHLHIHDGHGLQLAPIGAGEIDHRRVVELLQGSGYRGFLSGEWIDWEAYEIHLPRELATLKHYERAAPGTPA